MQHSKHVVLFAAANDTLLNPNTCTNEESGVQTKAKILCRIAPGTNNDGIFKQQFNGDSGLLDCFDPEVMETLLSGFPCNQDIDVVVRYKLINPNGFDMRVVLGRNEAGDTVSTKENGKRTRLIFNDRDVTFSTTSETALSDGMIIPAKQSHIAVVITKIKSCQQSLYQAEMKMKLKPVDSSNGSANMCSAVDIISLGDAVSSNVELDNTLPDSDLTNNDATVKENLQKKTKAPHPSPKSSGKVTKSPSMSGSLGKGTKSPSINASLGKGSKSSSGKGKGKTFSPSVTPSLTPSVTPSVTPSLTPSLTPSVTPSLTPSVTPSVTPSLMPSNQPSESQCPQGFVTYVDGVVAEGEGCGDNCCIGGSFFGNTFEACEGFTGRVCRDGSCNGINSCRDAEVDTVSGSSCSGTGACRSARSVEISDQSCQGQAACRSLGNRDDADGFKVTLITGGSCSGEDSCRNAIVESVLEGSCVGENSCKASTIVQVSGGSCDGDNACRNAILDVVSGSCCNGNEGFFISCLSNRNTDCCGFAASGSVTNCG